MGEGLRLLQMYKNNRFHEGIKQSRFETLFGHKAQWGLTSSLLPASISTAQRTNVEAAFSSIQSMDVDYDPNDEEMEITTGISESDHQNEEMLDKLHHRIKRN